MLPQIVRIQFIITHTNIKWGEMQARAFHSSQTKKMNQKQCKRERERENEFKKKTILKRLLTSSFLYTFQSGLLLCKSNINQKEKQFPLMCTVKSPRQKGSYRSNTHTHISQQMSDIITIWHLPLFSDLKRLTSALSFLNCTSFKTVRYP